MSIAVELVKVRDLEADDTIWVEIGASGFCEIKSVEMWTGELILIAWKHPRNGLQRSYINSERLVLRRLRRASDPLLEPKLSKYEPAFA